MGREAEKATLLKTVSLVPLLARSGFRPSQLRRKVLLSLLKRREIYVIKSRMAVFLR